MKTQAIEKVLSRNDTGETGGHQAGILVPKNPEVLAFFPTLDGMLKNPRAVLRVVDELGQSWNFNFIYYNNKKFGGTRNEYRLTGMTAYVRQLALHAGDTVTLTKSGVSYTIHGTRAKDAQPDSAVKLGTVWKVVKVEER